MTTIAMMLAVVVVNSAIITSEGIKIYSLKSNGNIW